MHDMRSLRPASAIVVTVAVAAAAGAFATSDGRSTNPANRLNSLTLPDAKITVTFPFNWYVTTRRLDYLVDPHTLLAVASYVIPFRAGANCDGTQGRGRPVDGAFILLKEVLDRASLRRSLPRLSTRPIRFNVPSGGRAGCLPPYSAVYQFRVASRAFYVYVSVGPRATKATRAAVARVLDTMKIAPTR
jgi:hypothetical protein